jgi:hypothetical protein
MGQVVGGTYKLEARNSKHETISNDQNPNNENPVTWRLQTHNGCSLFLSLRHSGFEFVSDFEIRISDFCPLLALVDA